MLRKLILIPCLAIFVPCFAVARGDALHFGFASADITPQTPLRLSGYANRSEPFDGVDEPLWVRVMGVRGGTTGPVHVLVSVDTIGLPGTLTKSILERVTAKHGIPRERFVICCSHSHTAPEVGALADMFDIPLTAAQQDEMTAYTTRLSDGVVEAVGRAIADLQPGRMFAGEGEATFAVNRRVLTDGVWSGFGINPAGPVDHRLPFLKVTSADGKTIRGILFNYACHCTTFGGEYNRVNGDWAGYASKALEAAHKEALALCTIGTGADANPQRDRDRALEISRAQGQEIADEINGLLEGELVEVTSLPRASFGYAGLPIDRPTKAQLEEGLKHSRRPVRVHAEKMLATLERMGRLPETYPMPIQVWRFGDQLTMAFLGGEVCVDYGLRIKRELTASADEALPAKSPLTPWVVAYANDVFGYVASERMRAEGGYEVDFSMIYYMLPGRWSSGTEEVILRRVHEMSENTGKVGPLSADEARGTFTLPPGYELEIVASEPLIRDPVNVTRDEQGRLWVVEMGDYPRGGPAHELDRQPGSHPFEGGPPGGSVKILTDRDGDGRYDEAVTFLDGLSFPTAVLPWKDGALLTVAPDLLFARDTDGDGRADEQDVLYSGFKLANPQHRINGLIAGPDGWLYLASGDDNREPIRSTMSGETLDMAGRDLRVHPATGRMEAISGRSQYGRTCSLWGDWFGNDNSDPLWHFVIEDRYLRRNPFVSAPSPKVYLTQPHRAPPVYPTSRTLDRFNDLFALDRFTSACSPYIWRAASGEDQLTALVCEPVHNLVSRVMLKTHGVTFQGERHASEQQSEFFSSTDNWFRPVRVIEEPEGSLLVCDMYRQVIEHPEWIPEAWQAQLDLYAGHDMGRIYRLKPPPSARTTPPPAAVAAAARFEELQTADQADELSTDRLIAALSDDHPLIVRWAAQTAEGRLADQPALVDAILPLAQHPDIRVRFQVALVLGSASSAARVADVLLHIARQDPDDPWIRAAVLSAAVPHADAMLTSLLRSREDVGRQSDLMEGLIATALGRDVQRTAPQVARLIAPPPSTADVQPWQMSAVSRFLDALERRGTSWSEILASDPESAAALTSALQPVFEAARQISRDASTPVASRAASLPLLGHEPNARDSDLQFVQSLLSPREAPELQAGAVSVLAQRAGSALPAMLLAGWSGHTPALRQTVINTLLSRENWMHALTIELEAGRVPAGDLDASARQRLLTTWNGPVREAAARLYGAAAASDRAGVVATYAAADSQPGDLERGALVFKKVCSACHQHGGMGKDLGPRLATLQNKSADALLTAILDPNRAVEQKYAGYVVVTADGRALSGLIKSETGSSLLLAEPNGAEHAILRIDIEELRSTGKSFMPEGLEKDLSPQDIADVIAFLQQGT